MRRTLAVVFALAVAALPGRAALARGDEPPAEHHHPVEVPVATSSASASRQIEAVAREHRHDAPTPSPAAQAAPRRGVSIMEGFAYAKLGKEGKPVMGYAAAALGPEPPKAAILVIHEWWGSTTTSRAWCAAWRAKAIRRSPWISTKARRPRTPHTRPL